jgi:hypothetical protein
LSSRAWSRDNRGSTGEIPWYDTASHSVKSPVGVERHAQRDYFSWGPVFVDDGSQAETANATARFTLE